MFVSTCLSEELLPNFDSFISADETYFCCLEDGTLFYAMLPSTIENTIRVKKINGKVLKFTPAFKRIPYGGDERTKLLMEKPILDNLTHMLPFGEYIVLSYEGYSHRSVQIIDKNLKVVKSWEDKLTRGDENNPACIDKKGIFTGFGEKGEILQYDQNGKVIKRFAIRGIFNESRIIKPYPISEETRKILTERRLKEEEDNKKFYADLETKKLQARDKLLPSPIFIKGERFPQFIKAMESRDNGNIIILDGEMTDEERGKVKKGEMEYRYQILYELNPETAEIKVLQIPGFKLLRENAQLKKEKGDEIKDDPIWDDEEIVDIRCKNDILCILTSYRALTVEFEPELRVTGEYHFHFDDEKNNDVAWDVTYTKPVKFLIVNLRKHRIDEYQPVPEKVGTPLDRGFAEEKKKEEAEEAEEIRVLDEFEKRHQEEKKIIPVSEADKEAARELVDLFHERLIAGELDKIPDMLHNDFVSETSTTKRTYVKEVLPTMYSDIKEHDVIAKINSRIGESSYTNDTRSIIKSQIELIVIDKEGKVREFEKGKILFYFYFIKSKNGMQILEMDTKDRTERFKKDETEDEAE